MNAIKNENNFCPVRDVMDRFGDKWSILILIELHKNGKARFNELNRAIPDVSQKMLTVSLRRLVSDCLISRKAYPEIPPRVEYQLTEIGLSLMPHIIGLVEWALENRKECCASRM